MICETNFSNKLTESNIVKNNFERFWSFFVWIYQHTKYESNEIIYKIYARWSSVYRLVFIIVC